MRLIFLGAPGAGKGTQARMVAERYGIPQISTGDIFRAAVRDGTLLGKRAKEYMDAGRLVPDDVVVGLVAERLKGEDCKAGYILDGFPRTLAQAQALEDMMRESGDNLDHVILLEVPEEELVLRLSGRRTCLSCGQGYHVKFDPPRIPEMCNRCGGTLIQREDDREDTVRARLKVYLEETQPLIDFYERGGVLKRLSGVGQIEEIFERLTGLLDG
mgnify:CR=1 FL=1